MSVCAAEGCPNEIPASGRRLYCSPECKVRSDTAKRRAKRVRVLEHCQTCGGSLADRPTNALTCGGPCWNAVRRLREGRRAGPRMCRDCGTNPVTERRQFCDACKAGRKVRSYKVANEVRKARRLCKTCRKVMPDDLAPGARYCRRPCTARPIAEVEIVSAPAQRVDLMPSLDPLAPLPPCTRCGTVGLCAPSCRGKTVNGFMRPEFREW